MKWLPNLHKNYKIYHLRLHSERLLSPASNKTNMTKTINEVSKMTKQINMDNKDILTIKDRGNSVDKKYRYGVQHLAEHSQFLFLGESYSDANKFAQAYQDGWTHALAS